MKKNQETRIYAEMSKMIMYNNGHGDEMEWDIGDSDVAMKVTFESIVKYLSIVKSKDKVAGLIIQDYAGNFHFGAFVTFVPGTEDESQGSYALSFTYDENDLKEAGAVTVSDTNPLFRNAFDTVCFNKYGIRFDVSHDKDFSGNTIDHDYAKHAMVCVVDSIKNYLEVNYMVEDEVELTGYFTARGEKDGEKVYVAITPSAELKQMVKDDASLESDK